MGTWFDEVKGEMGKTMTDFQRRQEELQEILLKQEKSFRKNQRDFATSASKPTYWDPQEWKWPTDPNVLNKKPKEYKWNY